MAEAHSTNIMNRIFGMEGTKGLGLLEVLGHRYDVVCTNPPYMGSTNMGSILKGFIGKKYSPGKADLYAAFIIRCYELAKTNSQVAMVTQQTWMFLKSFESLRALKNYEKSLPFRGILFDTSIDILTHIGPRGFSEISGEVVNSVLIVFRKSSPPADHQLTAIRLVDLKNPSHKDNVLRNINLYQNKERCFVASQIDFQNLPLSPIVYWMENVFIEILSKCDALDTIASVKQGLATGNDDRFRRWVWEIIDLGTRWFPYTKGGGYRKWWGFNNYLVDWENNGSSIKNSGAGAVRNEQYYMLPGLTHGQNTQGSISVRILRPGSVFGGKGPATHRHDKNNPCELLILMNSRLASYLLRAITCGMDFTEGYVALLPIPLNGIPKIWSELAVICVNLKKKIVITDPTEEDFNCFLYKLDNDNSLSGFIKNIIINKEKLWMMLLILEAYCEKLVFNEFNLNNDKINIVTKETGTPSGRHPIIYGYDKIPNKLNQSISFPNYLIDYIDNHRKGEVSNQELVLIKRRINNLYVSGPSSSLAYNEKEINWSEPEHNEGNDASLKTFIPIPPESFIEELSQKIMIHPISLYLIIDELRNEEDLICPPEFKGYYEEYLLIKLLCILGHRWPMQDQYEKEEGKLFIDPRWVDGEGIIPLTPGTGKETLIEFFRRFLDEEFGPENGPPMESEAGQILGWKPGDEWGRQTPTTLERWFEREFFKRHVSQFKRRPIAWHLTSARGAFQAMVYYHKFDKNGLTLLRARYVREALDTLRQELGKAQAAGTDRQALAKVADLEAKVAEVQDFEAQLQRLLEGRDREARIWCPWKKMEEQPLGWDPDINDGVRVNIAPVQRLGLLAAPVLSAKDLKSLLAPEGRG
jgi:hypothetical protein